MAAASLPDSPKGLTFVVEDAGFEDDFVGVVAVGVDADAECQKSVESGLGEVGANHEWQIGRAHV